MPLRLPFVPASVAWPVISPPGVIEAFTPVFTEPVLSVMAAASASVAFPL
jgi:hypothetical protein